jgi:hypothetical protein
MVLQALLSRGNYAGCWYTIRKAIMADIVRYANNPKYRIRELDS